jgi:transcription factor SPN1
LEDVSRVRKNAVRIPERNLGDYTVIPKSTVGMGGQGSTVEVERRRMNAERLRKMKRKLDLNRQKVARNR